ncbi:hypothetical protein [Candidatus Mycoplasma haematohominis]|uniref:Uncharacterized protein n=1 Tax=Candidatus Mycoplasma haematohominis TaxID=1494318 RepID=A0A478FP42_9MOLU|nr:hypothetical protein [Candidatus Mycoplasma haemohominis]GCE63061.1 hypothetical protein MHSWG343_00390 [Candidatus Mycoplasma haemohominis]
MASPTAVGGGALGAAAIGVGGAYLAGAFGGLDSSEPVRVLLSKDSTFDTEYKNTSNIGKEYGNYLVAPIGSREEEGVTKNNEAWWQWSYKRWKADSDKQNDNLSDEFKDSKKIDSAFSKSAATSDSPKALNKVCEDVYKKTKDSVIPAGSSTEDKTKLKNDLFKYCSILGELKTISEVVTETYVGANKKGADPTNSKKFMAATANNKFWEIRNKEFYAGGDGEKSKSKATGNSKFKNGLDGNPNSNVRDICAQAYESGTSDTADYPIADVERFCVL